MNSAQSFSSKMDDIWLKASVMGSLWASFEIIAGSLLHNLHVPFSGSILTAFAVILLISFAQLWPHRGLIWRAGLICALMKSVSPSAVILGPMIGILSEALIIEIVIFISGRNIIAFIIGGSLAMLSSLAHKIINLIILYGFDVVNIYMNLYQYFIRQLGSVNSSPEILIYLLAMIYIIAGSVAALIGFFIGRKALTNKKEIKTYPFHSPWNKVAARQNPFRITILAAHLVYVPLVLYIFFYFNDLLLDTILTISYFLFSILYYRNISGKLLKPLFWIQLSVIIILAALFLESSAPGKYSIINGLKGGIEMFLRAILIITAFASISIELLNPVIKKYLIKHGFEKLYASLQLSFNALPAIIENTTGHIKWVKNPLKSLTGILNEAESWFNSFKENSVHFK